MADNQTDEQIQKNIIQSLKEGMFKRDAAVYNGITEVTFYRWVKANPAFKDAVEKAILEYKRSLIITVNINAVKSGKIALEVLRTRWPKEWNVAKKVQLTDPEGELKRLMSIIMGTASPEDLPDSDPEESPDDQLPKLPEQTE